MTVEGDQPDAGSTGPLQGIRVVEMASWMFVPSGGSVLADWGAEVLKIENPQGGDPQRGLITSGLVPGGAGGVNFMIEQPNRSKRSVAINVAHPDGREAFMKLIESADVFLTNYLPPIRRKLKIDTDDILARNPNIVIARGTGQGPNGPDAEKGGYDGASYWARGGLGSVFPPDKDGWPMPQSSPAFGDVIGGLATAGAIAAALLKRERTGETSVVDVSLLATALWQISPLVVASKLFGMTSLPRGDRRLSPNPGVGVYRTRDDRFISLILLQSDKHWEDFAARLDRPILVEDERFNYSSVRAQNGPACIDIIDEAFAERTLAEWKERLETFEGVWTPFQTLPELYSDRQVIANTYLPSMEHSSGQEVQLVASPAQFDEQPIAVERAPELGEHTELVLSEVGFDWPEIIAMKESGAIL
ncbi:MAG: CoA transferase [Acidimicrobiaceae bacterium]|nr:CoA transferase [Acidimicrobiaceae bacterium]MYD05352.1 CoA transferase [Acidimicrobiaceae bacterium]MYI57815.1 CoA transferase [Acidimicrobiaceae bacterium]